MDSSITKLVFVTRTPARNEIADDGADPNADGDSLIGIFADGLIRHLHSFNRLLPNATIDFFAAFQRGGQAFTGLSDLVSSDVRSGGHQRARIVCELTHVTADGFCLFAHSLDAFGLVVFFIGELMASAR
jgi:hypothetical protein